MGRRFPTTTGAGAGGSRDVAALRDGEGALDNAASGAPTNAAVGTGTLGINNWVDKSIYILTKMRKTKGGTKLEALWKTFRKLAFNTWR